MAVVVAYTRVSTNEQAVHGSSLPQQQAEAAAWCGAHGHVLSATYTDAGLSGTLGPADRPGLAAALDRLSTGGADVLYVRSLDRLARALTMQEALLAAAWACPGVEVWTSSGIVPRDDPTDPMREAMRQMAGVFAQLERSTITARLRSGRSAKASRGEHANGPAPYGWTSITGTLHPIPAEQAALAVLTRLRARGYTLARLADILNEDGHPSRSGRRWSAATVGAVLRAQDRLTPAQRDYRAARLASAE